jgi:hypothetical protein
VCGCALSPTEELGVRNDVVGVQDDVGSEILIEGRVLTRVESSSVSR